MNFQKSMRVPCKLSLISIEGKAISFISVFTGSHRHPSIIGTWPIVLNRSFSQLWTQLLLCYPNALFIENAESKNSFCNCSRISASIWGVVGNKHLNIFSLALYRRHRVEKVLQVATKKMRWEWNISLAWAHIIWSRSVYRVDTH